MPTVEQKLIWANKRCSYAWAKYYEAIHERLHDDHIQYVVVNRVAEDKEIPNHIKEEMKEMAKALKKKWECPVCMEMIAEDALEITNCGHYYCKPCLEQWKTASKNRGDDKWKCCMCNRKHGFGAEE